ncbi:uncharacterized protein METZ01_LOCUS16832, partial [marine metagenome]
VGTIGKRDRAARLYGYYEKAIDAKALYL